MSSEENTKEKPALHPRNRNRERYDLQALTVAVPELAKFVKPNKYGDDSVDFASPIAVKLLNKALLSHYYGIKNWDFPDINLCPPIPGRADYIHHIADTLIESNFGRMPLGDKVTCLDVGVGANCIYPILGIVEYGWNFIGCDIDQKSLESAKGIVDANPQLRNSLDLRLQKNPAHIFTGVLGEQDKVDLTICNPPFHSSAGDAEQGTRRKIKNLSGKRDSKPELNFAGLSNELICAGGESGFISKMISESKKCSRQVYWFSTLVSKQSNLKGIYKSLESTEATRVKTITMGTGNKSTRIVAWSYLSKQEQKDWKDSRWNKK